MCLNVNAKKYSYIKIIFGNSLLPREDYYVNFTKLRFENQQTKF